MCYLNSLLRELEKRYDEHFRAFNEAEENRIRDVETLVEYWDDSHYFYWLSLNEEERDEDQLLFRLHLFQEQNKEAYEKSKNKALQVLGGIHDSSSTGMATAAS